MTDPLPDVCTAMADHVAACTAGGVAHDYRPHTYRTALGRTHTSLRCVWCHVVACGDSGTHDPCLEPYHHDGDHVSCTGVRWPIGGNPP